MNLPTNILLVDDEPRNLDVLEEVLRSPEHNLVRAAGAEQALVALLHADFAVIVLDIQMPVIDGIELAHLIKQRERTQHIPIIFLTAFYKDERRMLESYSVGAVDYLTKPANPEVLRSKVAVFVDLYRKTAALQQSNLALGQEIAQRLAAEEALRDTNEALEHRVETRTAALREARDAAERSGRAKDDFIAALSHELRTPLNPVLLIASEAAENPAFPAEARSQFLAIRKNVELEARLIDDLLDLTRVTHGKMTLEVGSHDPQRIVRDAIYTVGGEIEQKGIELRLELEDQERRVAVDEVRLQQVFWNLLKNAVKFTPHRGVITVTVRTNPAAGTIAISIADTGIGLSDQELKHIFDAFSQGDHATQGAHRFGGLGLGLAISKSLVELQGGALTARSAGPGLGATFTVTLPLSGAAAASARPNPTVELSGPVLAPPGSEPLRRRVLLVEDHEATRTALERLLQRRSYEVTSAGSLAEARTHTAAQAFDFLISDIGLPDGTGFDLMREMREQGSVRGIALTGYGTEEDVSRSHEAGFLLHLTKPILVQSLDKALIELHR